MSLLADKDKLIELNQTMTIFEIYKKYGGSPSLFQKKFQFYGIKPKVHFSSFFEKEVRDFLESSISVPITTRLNHSTKFEIDLFVKDYNLAIECNGLYWHSELNGKGKNYHLNKSKFYEDKQIKLLHIFSDDWTNKNEICKSIILSKLKKLKSIGARKTTIIELTKEQEIDFFNQNHIQGYVKSKLCLGLLFNNEIIAAMSFGQSRFNKKYQWELLRFSNKLNISVTGGANKLFKAFRLAHKESILSYCHRHLFNGDIYKNIGMKFIKFTKPNYFYTIDYKNKFNRIQFQKHKLKSKLEDFDPALTEWENMQNHGYDRIWDCGNSMWAID